MVPLSSPLLVRVAFNVRVDRLFDYEIPVGVDTDLVGRRVQAPLGHRQAIGIVVAVTHTSEVPREKLKTVVTIFDDMPPLPKKTLALLRFCADYYHCPIGLAIATALPAFFRRPNTYQPPTGYRLVQSAKHLPIKGKVAKPLLALLAEQGTLSLAQMQEQLGRPAATLRPPLKRLIAAHLVERCHLYNVAPSTTTHTAPPTLTDCQQQVYNQLRLQQGFVPHLLFGATGSGKTEIYMRAMVAVLEKRQQVLILTPEIHLTPQLENQLRERFPTHSLAVLHSHLTDGERAHRWLMARLGKIDIILGTRLSVFTPMPQLGLIIVDEEHDGSYKQEERLAFSARNVAVWRAKNENIPFIAGSATPSLESYTSAQQGRWQLLPLSQRIIPSRLTFQIITTTEKNYHGLDSEFLRLLSDYVNRGKQVLIFINRRGYAPTLICQRCHTTVRCRRCSVNMTVHRRRDMLCCHLCGYTLPIALHCSACGGLNKPLGTGTQRIEEALKNRFSSVPQLRLDSDTMTGRHFIQHRDSIVSGQAQLLIGTQIIAKGHNFPHLSLIGILDTDQALTISDFRAEERLFALLSQVIGRGTRNPDGCHVAIQTRYPQHPFYAHLTGDNVQGYWQQLLQERKKARLPPFAHLAILRAKDTSVASLNQFMRQLSDGARRSNDSESIRIFDPVPSPVEKVGGWHCQQLLIHALYRRPLHQFLNRWIPTITGKSRWRIDIDPEMI